MWQILQCFHYTQQMPWVALSLGLLVIQWLLTRCSGEASKLQSATGCTCEDFILFLSFLKALNWPFSSWKIMCVLPGWELDVCLQWMLTDSRAGTVTYLQTTMRPWIHSPFVTGSYDYLLHLRGHHRSSSKGKTPYWGKGKKSFGKVKIKKKKRCKRKLRKKKWATHWTTTPACQWLIFRLLDKEQDNGIIIFYLFMCKSIYLSLPGKFWVYWPVSAEFNGTVEISERLSNFFEGRLEEKDSADIPVQAKYLNQSLHLLTLQS